LLLNVSGQVAAFWEINKKKVCLFVRPPVGVEQLGFHRTDFHEI
jgi:hypothetical protein